MVEAMVIKKKQKTKTKKKHLYGRIQVLKRNNKTIMYVVLKAGERGKST